MRHDKWSSLLSVFDDFVVEERARLPAAVHAVLDSRELRVRLYGQELVGYCKTMSTKLVYYRTKCTIIEPASNRKSTGNRLRVAAPGESC